MNRKEKLLREIEFEKEKKFNEHIVPPAFNKIDKVKPDYNYTRNTFKQKVGSFFAVLLFKLVGVFIAPYCRFKIIGKKNLKKAKKAILTSNHINDIDCVLIKKAVKNKRLKIVVAEFNNPKGFLGALLRAGGTLPIGTSVSNTINMSKAIKQFLNENQFVLFYPEGSEWWCYEKPRPLIRGAFYYAVKNNVPVIPMFFTFKTYKTRKDGTPKKKFILNIGNPLYPNESLEINDRITDLLDRTFEYNKNIYESFYNKKLEYIE